MTIKYRKDLINYFIKIFKYTTYLEIGVRNPSITFNTINIKHKEGVDPDGSTTYTMTSDEFFSLYSKKWDIILIDGSHEKLQVKKDILNSLNHLNKNGTLILHDVNPPTKDKLSKGICGNAWEAYAELRTQRKDLEMFVLPINYLGVIRVGKQTLWKDKIQNTFEYLDNNRKDLMNEISLDEMFKKYGRI